MIHTNGQANHATVVPINRDAPVVAPAAAIDATPLETMAAMIAARESRDWAWRHAALAIVAAHSNHDGNLNKMLRQAETAYHFIKHGVQPKDAEPKR